MNDKWINMLIAFLAAFTLGAFFMMVEADIKFTMTILCIVFLGNWLLLSVFDIQKRLDEVL